MLTALLLVVSAVRFGGSTQDGAFAVAANPSNVVAVGHLNRDIVIRKYTASLAFQWQKLIPGSTEWDSAQAVVFDASGNIITGGNFTNAITICGANMVSAGGEDGWLAKFDTNSTCLWAKRIGGTTLDAVLAVQVDPVTQDVYAAGYMNATGNTTAFISKYSGTNGTLLWTKTPTCTGSAVVNALSLNVDGDGRFVAAGEYTGTCDWGDGTTPITVEQYTDFFVVALNPNGTMRWVNQLKGSKGVDRANALGQYREDVYVVGNFTNQMLGMVANASCYDGFVLHFDEATGVLMDTQEIGHTDDCSYDVDITGCDANGVGPVVTGTLWGTISTNCGTLSAHLTGPDGYTARLTPTGCLWQERWGGDAYDRGWANAFGEDGNIFAVGFFNGVGHFGAVNLTSAGNDDGYLVKVSP